MKKLISVIAPMYNEEQLVETYCTETMNTLNEIKDQYNYEIILVNDGSRDKTFLKMLEIQTIYSEVIGVINLSRNFGLEGAINAGLKKALGDIVVVMDADLQDPPKLILDMLKEYENGVDVVTASRVKRSNDNLFKKVTAKIYYNLLNSLSGKLKLEESAANYRLLSRAAVNKLLELPEVNGVFRVLVPFVGMKTAVVEYERDKRFAGKTKYNFPKMIVYALDSLTGISVSPLRKIFYVLPFTLIVFVIALIGIIFTTGAWKATYLIIFTTSLFFGILFGILVLMAEYIAQLMIEVKGRPTSIIYEYKPSKNAQGRE